MRSHSSGMSASTASCIRFEALEDVGEDLIEPVEVALVLHQAGAREIVEILDAAVGEVCLHCLQE